MKNNFTQGEWKVKQKVGSSSWSMDIISDKGHVIAHTDTSFTNDFTETNSNAKLIAAAPDLLRALNGLVNYVRDNFNIRGDNILIIADEAIKQATS